MPAGHDHGLRAERMDRARQLLGRRGRARQHLGLRQVRRDDVDERKQALAQRVAGIVGRAGARRSRPPSRGRARPGRRRRGRAPRPRRRSSRPFRASRSSPRPPRCRRRPGAPARRSPPAGSDAPRDTPTVFCAVIAVIAVIPCTPQARERLQVRLDARSAAGVGAGDRQHAWDAAHRHRKLAASGRWDVCARRRAADESWSSSRASVARSSAAESPSSCPSSSTPAPRDTRASTPFARPSRAGLGADGTSRAPTP